MTYPFVAAKWFTKGAMTEARAVIWHMAEGWGTVGYFTRVANNVSSHFVIEQSGRIVQMVRLTDASHTQHVQIDPDDSDASDCGGLYSDALARKLLGSGWADVNRYVVGIEVEGFRKDGPNAAQRASIAELGAYLRRELPTLRGNLGHRDVQDYKSCPGCKFPWAVIGGHGAYAPEEADMPGLEYSADVTQDAEPFDALGTGKLKAGTAIRIVNTSTMRLVDLPEQADLGVVQLGTLTAAQKIGSLRPAGTRIVLFTHGDTTHAALLDNVDFTPLPKPSMPEPIDCGPAIAKFRETAADAAAAAVRGVQP